MKTRKSILALLLVVVLVFSSVSSSFAQTVQKKVISEAGQTITVEFKYDDIVGINGTFTYSNSGMFSDISLLTSGLTNGMYNPSNGMVAYYGATPVDCTIKLTLTVSKSAKAGDTCTITFKYESTSDGNMPSEPDYKYDTATITVLSYTELEKQIGIAEGLNKADYTSDSWAKLDSALKAAKTALSSDNQTTVNNAAKALEDAIAGLKKASVPPSVDYTELKKQIGIAEGLTKSSYTSDSWAKLDSALYAAKSALSSTSQTTVNNAAKALADAIAGLKKVSVTSKVDYSELKKQIGIAEGLTKSSYTSDSWTKLESALTKAKSALNSSSQSEVNSAASNLASAIKALVKASSSNTSTVDYTELKKQISAAEALDENKYTAVSWSVLEDALAAAKKAESSKSQSEVDSAAAALKTAIGKLVAVDYSALLSAIESTEGLTDVEELANLWNKLQELLNRAQGLLEGNDQEAIDSCAKEINDVLNEIIAKLNALKAVDSDEIADPVPTEPEGDYCNIGMHRVWPVLFWISFALNLGAVGFVVFLYLRKKKKESDDTPLVDYDISDDVTEDAE